MVWEIGSGMDPLLQLLLVLCAMFGPFGGIFLADVLLERRRRKRAAEMFKK